MLRTAAIATISALLAIAAIAPALGGEYLDSLKPGKKIHGFSVACVYENAAGKAMGARFISDRYGFILDVMRIQSVPQAFFWVKTPPTSSKGEPHTCEHLLLGKGNRGRYVAALEDMSLGNSSAYTSQIKTCYHFNTIAGTETFYDLFEAKLLAFVQPDYTDEEIRREVCHLGVTEDAESGMLELEEKGTVYTEMVSSFERPWYHYGNAMSRLIYGDDHPVAYVSGGNPADIRNCSAEDLRVFHRDYYHLANMGMIVAIADDIQLDDFLDRTARILEICQPEPTGSEGTGMNAYSMPGPEPAPYGTLKLVTFPSDNKQEPGRMYFAWPAHLDINNDDVLMLELFLSAFADGATSNLYNLFINSETRIISIGGNTVWNWTPNYPGHPIWLALEGLNNEYITGDMVDSVRTIIVDELTRIQNLEDGSQGLEEFNREVRSHLVRRRKQIDDFLNSPPMFGARRGPASTWLSMLEYLENDEGFRKSLALKDHFAYAEGLLDSGKNPYRDLIRTWGMLEVLPYAIGAAPDPAMLEDLRAAKEDRLQGCALKIMDEYGAGNEQDAIARYRQEFDANTANLERIAANQTLPEFIDNPPMTLDDHLKYEVMDLPGGVPMVASTFENMNSSTVGIAFGMDVVPEDRLVYVPCLPGILTSIGVVEHGVPVKYDEMQERLRKDVLRFNAYYDYTAATGRIELILTGAGSSADELANAINWMDMALYSPYLSEDNLPRMTDLLDQSLISLRNTTKLSEEDWVRDPATAYRLQSNPLFLSTSSFMTQVHHFQRVRCFLAQPGSADEQHDLSVFIDALADIASGRDRDELAGILSAIETEDNRNPEIDRLTIDVSDMGKTARENATMAAAMLRASLPDIPDATLEKDWNYLCRQMGADIMVEPAVALDEMKNVLALISKSDNARIFIISNSDDRDASMENVRDFAGRLDSRYSSMRQDYDPSLRVVERARDRDDTGGRPVYAGLIHEATANGVLIHSAEFASQYDSDTDAVLDCLAGKMYGGGGAHSMFMKTWGAGLAYSNGLSANQMSGRVGYYAERCPDVAQTMGFVVNELKTAPEDPSLAGYSVAQVFRRSRAMSRYEARGQAMATDLADGYTPERVSAYRGKVLEVSKREDLYPLLAARMEMMYGKVMIGYGDPLAESTDGYFFLIGPEEQFASLEKYIEDAEGRQTVRRLYPRDFWMVGPEAE
jgi:Zn-dependent M16 (insulinase) family peptidase